MKITNKFGLPEAFVSAVSKDYEYKPKRYSVTTLLQPLRVTLLKRRHDEDLEEDCADSTYRLLGTAVHRVLEDAKSGDMDFSEEKLVIDVGDGYALSGIFDVYQADEFRVCDYKTTSVTKIARNDTHDYWIQTLCYAYMLRKNGFECDKGRIIAIMRDWMQSKALYDKEYPQCPVEVIDFFFKDEDFVYIENWINERFGLIKQLELLEDDELPECTDEEKFKSPDSFAVKKKGRKTAMRVLNSMELAEQWMQENGGDFVEQRKGEPIRCQRYCNCNKFCKYYKGE